VAFDPDLRRYAFGEDDGTVTVQGFETGVGPVRLPGGFGAPANAVAFSPDGRLLAVTYRDTLLLRVWDLGRQKAVLTVRQVRWPVPHFAFRPDARQLAVVAPDGSIPLYDLATGAEVRRLAPGLAFAYRGDDQQLVAFRPDGRWLAVAGEGTTTAHVLDAETGEVVARLAHPWTEEIQALAWHPDGRTLASAVGRRVAFWEPAAGADKPCRTVDHQSWVTGLAYDPAGRVLATTGHDATLRLWHPDLPQPLVSVPGALPVFSRDGRRVAYRQAPTRVGLLEFVPSEECGPLPTSKGMMWLPFAPGGRLVTKPSPGGARLMDVVTRSLVAVLPPGPDGSTTSTSREPPGWWYWTAGFDPATGDLLAFGEAGLCRWPVTPRPGKPGGWTVGPPRAGDWAGAAAALEEALKRLGGDGGTNRGVGRSLLVLAMARHRLGEHDTARRAYDRGRGWLAANRKALDATPWFAAELEGLRAEAAEVLGLAGAPPRPVPAK
jgi:YD repeat-containing protein